MRHSKGKRENDVLEIIVNYYVGHASPVGSRFVSRKLGLSSATIRNVMKDLEEFGLISQPHTSAGRVPTDEGYRYYINSLMRLKKLTERQVLFIESEFRSRLRSLEELLEKTSHILSMVTHCAGITLMPKMDRGTFKHIELVPLTRNRILVLLVTASGLVKSFVFDLDYAAEETYLRKISNFLNREVYDMTLQEIREHLIKKLKEERNSSYTLISRAYELIETIYVSGLKAELYMDGASYILSQPEFREQKKMASILKFLENKTQIADILSEDMDDEILKIHIGRENISFGLDDFSIITKGYRIRNNVFGRLGVIGPTRMDYDKVIPMVDYLGEVVSKVLFEAEE